MKKIVLILLLVVAFTRLCAQRSTISIPVDNNGKEESGNATISVKKGKSKTYLNNFSTRAVRDFNRRFGDRDQPSWVRTRDGGYAAKFSRDSIKSMAYYTCGGYWQATLRYYGENKLPKDIRTLIKRQYFDYAIGVVTEIEGSEKTIYEVQLSAAHEFKIIRVDDDEIRVVGDYVN